MKKFYPDDLADKLKGRTGQKYRPSNGTEGGLFMALWCAECIHDDYESQKYCPIINAAMVYEKEDSRYPSEWQYGKDGQPKCTRFQKK